MTHRFRFIGIESSIGEVRLCTFGQAIDLDPETAHDCILGRVPLVTDEAFAAAGFTDEELNAHGDWKAHADDTIDPVFKAKKLKLFSVLVVYRAQYEKDADAGNTFMARAAKPTPSPTLFDEEPPVQYDAH